MILQSPCKNISNLLRERNNFKPTVFHVKEIFLYHVYVIHAMYICFKVCLHVPSPSLSPSKFIIVSIEMDHLTGRMGSIAILPVKQSFIIDTM